MLLDASNASAIERAADILAGGGLLGLPTETVYGLAARADDDRAVAAIFAAKGRPAGHPLIVHVADAAGAEPFVQEGFLQQLPDHSAALMRAFWPGPLTVIVPRREGVANAAAGRHPTIGLRSPAHPAAQAVLRALLQRGVPGLAAPSANRFGSVSPTTAQHVLQEFGEAVPVLDAGACPVGIESTIIDCSRCVPVLLRPGAINLQWYTAGEGGYPYWHCELFPRDPGGETLHRHLLWTLYLNDGFAEGETEFLFQQRHHGRNQGPGCGVCHGQCEQVGCGCGVEFARGQNGL